MSDIFFETLMKINQKESDIKTLIIETYESIKEFPPQGKLNDKTIKHIYHDKENNKNYVWTNDKYELE